MRRAAPLVLILALAAPAARAVRPLTPPAPELPATLAWVNSKPFSLAFLKGRRAVLLAFINTANINSLRAVESLNAWNSEYGLEGLMIIGVHTPDYAFQKDPNALRQALKFLGVEFPVVVDNDRLAWRAYANEGWPAFYLIDHKGRIIFDRLGEGGYAELEAEIRAAVGRVPGYAQPKTPPIRTEDAVGKDCGPVTLEASAGSARNKIRDLDQETGGDRLLLLETRRGEVSTLGKWTKEPERVVLAQSNAEDLAFVRVFYQGAQAFALIGDAVKPVRVYIRQDGLPLHPGNAPHNVKYEADGRSFIVASGRARLYEAARNSDDQIHELSLLPRKPGTAVYGFSFADQCLRVDLPWSRE